MSRRSWRSNARHTKFKSNGTSGWSRRLAWTLALLSTCCWVGCQTPTAVVPLPVDRSLDLKDRSTRWTWYDAEGVRRALSESSYAEIAGVGTVSLSVPTFRGLVGRKAEVNVVEVPVEDLKYLLLDREEWVTAAKSAAGK